MTNDVKIIVAIKKVRAIIDKNGTRRIRFRISANPLKTLRGVAAPGSHMDKVIEKVSAYGPSYCVDLHDLVQPAIRRWSARSNKTVGRKMERFDFCFFAGGIGWKKKTR